MGRIDFLIPGDTAALTGGYTYDRELSAAIRAAGFEVVIRQLAEDLSQPAARTAAEAITEALPDGALVLVDGLALAELADLFTSERHRLRLCALVHHPAALEAGLTQPVAERIAERELTALRAMDRIICTSHWTANELTGAGLPGQRIRVVEPGIDAAMAACAARRRREPKAARLTDFRLLCVATLTPRKGHDVLVTALAGLKDLDWQLECIGSRSRAPEHAAAIESLIAQHRLEDRIRLRGELQRDALADAYAQADLFVLASQLEGYGMVFAEAQAFGLPIVATSGGATEQTLAGPGAIVVEGGSATSLTQALRIYMTDRELREQLVADALENAGKTRDWQQVAAEFVAALEIGAAS